MTEKTSTDPFANGLLAFAQQVRDGEQNIPDALEYCLQRIERYDSHLEAFQAVDAPSARKQAVALQALLESGTDLGPLMGVPIGIKDLIAVHGFETTNGSLHESSLPGPEEGQIVQALRQTGCIIVGKTKTVEFALGATGLNAARGTPHNPWDWENHRLPGGSSSGSGVAVAAGFVAFAIGSDTGGSVRIPACFNGLFGHKTSVGLWPTDGVFPLSPTLDSLGPLCRSAADAALLHEVLWQQDALLTDEEFADDEGNGLAADLSDLSLAIPKDLFFEQLDPSVARAFELAVEKLHQAGASIYEVDLPEAHEREELFPKIVPPELINALGREGYQRAAVNMDPVTRQRAEAGLSVDAIDYVGAKQRHDELAEIGEERFGIADAWITPTCPFEPMTLESLQDDEMHQRSLQASRNTQPGNLLKLCASSLPIQHLLTESGDAVLPIGLQVMCRFDEDEELLHLSQRIQYVLGQAGLPQLPD